MIYWGFRIGKVNMLWGGYCGTRLRWTGAMADPTRERLYLIETKIVITIGRQDQASATSVTKSVARFKTADIAMKSKARYLAVCRHDY